MLFNRCQMASFATMVVLLSCVADGFFWSSSSESDQTPKPQLYAYPLPAIYQQRYLQAQQQMQQSQPLHQVAVQTEELPDQAVPAIPIQVPLQAQFAPIQNLHNVQLVPCLCPVSPNVAYEKFQEQSSSRDV